MCAVQFLKLDRGLRVFISAGNVPGNGRACPRALRSRANPKQTTIGDLNGLPETRSKMVAYWESSTRPLFVKTVWRDGQHHVVLGRDEERNTQTPSNSARSLRSAKVAPSNSKKVSSASVKLLLAGVGTFSASEQKLLRFKSSTNKDQDWPSTRETPITFKNVRQVLNTHPEYKSKTNRGINLSVKSNSLDINVDDRIGAVSPYLSYNTHVEPYNNSLSDKVMVWLDLASQNGNYVKEIKIQPQRIATACHVAQKLHHQASSKRRSFVGSKSSTNRANFFHVTTASQVVQSSQFSMSRRSASPNEEEEEKEPLPRDISVSGKRQLSSEVEENVVVKEVMQTLPRKQMDSVRRQLHIFIPNLPKKFSDCDSSILGSSKVSTCSLQRSILSSKNI